MKNPNTWIDKSTINLLASAIRALMTIEKTDDALLRNLLIKHAVIHAAFSVESCANILLYEYMPRGKLFDAIERLNVVEKFDFICLKRTGNLLDRERNEIAVCAELFKIRNEYVHPKVIKTNVKIVDIKQGHKQLNHDGKISAYLKLHERSDIWSFKNAKDTVSAAIKIINYVTLDAIMLSLADRESLFQASLTQEKVVYRLELQDFPDVKKYAKDVLNSEVKFI